MNRRIRKIKKSWNKFMFWLTSTKIKQSDLREIKGLFIIYFEGVDYDNIEPVNDTLIHRSKFEITNFEVYNTKKSIIVSITLVHPGILIGRGGKTIDGLKNYFNRILQSKYKKPITINIIESRLWF